MEGDPFVLIEGMAIAGFAVGASKGYVYTRSEYPHAAATFNAALDSSEREMIERALAESAGRVGGAKGAAAKLGLPRQTLESKIKILGINKFRFRRP